MEVCCIKCMEEGEHVLVIAADPDKLNKGDGLVGLVVKILSGAGNRGGKV